MAITPSESYNVIPNGRTVVRGTPMIRQEKILTATAKAGMLMQVDGTDYKAKPQATGGMPCGWLAFEETPAAISRPDLIDTAMVSGDVVGIVGGDIEVVAWFTGSAADADIVAGDMLTGNNDGTLVKWTSASTTPAVAIAAESKTITGATPANVVKLHVKSLI